MAEVKLGERSRDRAKKQYTWEDPKVVHEFPKGHQYEGYKVVCVDHPTDTASLGKLMGHCAGTHFIWTSEERIWFFFTILGPNGQPHVTVHAKQTKWLNKPHPRDSAPEIPQPQMGRTTCPKCKGYGGFRADGAPYYAGEAGVKTCTTCKGHGRIYPEVKGCVAPIRASAGGYPSFADVEAAFKEGGLEYEAGKYRPLTYNSTTYDRNGFYNAPRNSWDNQYAPYVIQKRPEHVTDEQWDTYQKVVREMKATFDKNSGAVKIEGREFKWDGKKVTILTMTGQGQSYDGGNKYRSMFHEALVELAKSDKKEVANGS